MCVVTRNKMEGMAPLMQDSAGEEEIKFKNGHLLHAGKERKKKRAHKYVRVYVCTLTSGSRTTTVLCGQGLGIRGSRTHDLCLNCESGCVHCIPAENLTYQLLD